MTGLIIVFFSFLTMFYYDPMYPMEKQLEGAAGPPHLVYFTYVQSIMKIFSLGSTRFPPRWAVCLFLYQSLDAIDGYTFV